MWQRKNAFEENLQIRWKNSKLKAELRNRENEISELRKRVRTLSDNSFFWSNPGGKWRLRSEI
jgi:hypothetical protein